MTPLALQESSPAQRQANSRADQAAGLRVLLVANSPADGQESMLRFAEMLHQGLAAADCEVEVIAPQAAFGRLASPRSDLGKWLAYLDKYLIFPIQLRRRLAKIRKQSRAERDRPPKAARRSAADAASKSEVRNSAIVHICDHSNAVYAAHVGGNPCVVTCHDLGAVRGALGEDTYCPASGTGKILQRWILNSLARADRVVCDSTATQNDLARLLGKRTPQLQVILLGQNQPFKRLGSGEADARLAAGLPALDLSRPYLLHVGSSLVRKNRDGILRIFHRIRDQWDGQLVFAGEGLSDELRELVEKLSLRDRVRVVERPTSSMLEALYSRAFALLFPSRFEGFGWPVVEAQACGCPVLCSDSSSLPEVAGAGALIRAVDDEAGFANDVLSLAEPAVRAALVQRGFDNLPRFDTRQMIDRYLAIYQELVVSK
jgi:glycosyltransferase involved in cell wall biosynthesis